MRGRRTDGTRSAYEPLADEDDEEARAPSAGDEPPYSRGEIQNEGSDGEELLTRRSAPVGGIGSSIIVGLGSPVQETQRRRQKSLKSAVNTMIASRRLSNFKHLVPGSAPGIDMRSSSPGLSHMATKFQTPARVTASEYSRSTVHMSQDLSLSDLKSLIRAPPGEGTVRWINVDGLNWDVLQVLATQYSLHPLACEDTLHVPQRTKADFYDGCLYLCMLAMRLASKHDSGSSREQGGQGQEVAPPQEAWGTFLDGRVEVQQVSMFLLKGNTLLTFFLTSSRSYTEPLLEQLRGDRTLLRNSADASFLMYRVMDTIVDHMQLISNEYDRILDSYEAKVTNGRPSAAYTQKLYGYQRELIQINRMIAPLDTLLSNLRAQDTQNSHMLTRLTAVYLSDVVDHVGTASEVVLGLSDECRDLISLIFNLTAHRQSIATQTLAVFSAVFLPITFLAGVYGVNFETVPEFKWAHGYSYFWALCFVVTALFSFVLKRMGMFTTYD